MPSIQHAIVALFARTIMRSGDIKDAEKVRAEFPANRKGVTDPGGDWVRREDVGPFPAWTLGEGAPLLFLHGGAYTKRMAKQHFALAERLVERTGRRVIMPEYPLAPEATWREVVPPLVEYAATLGEDLAVIGDSAGGGLALAVTQGLRDRGATPKRLVLISPWVDLTGTAPGIGAAARRDPWLRLDWLHLYAGWWAGSEADRERPEVSPGLGDLSGLPPTLTLQGTRDILHAENLALRDRARAAGWDYTYVEQPDLIHVYPLLPIPEAKVACRRIGEFLSA